MRRRKAQDLFRCDRCGETLYGAPNGVHEGDRCNSPIIAEFVVLRPGQTGQFLMKECFGSFVKLGVLS